MKLFIVLLFITSTFAQENFGVREKVNAYTEREIRKVLSKEFIQRLNKYKNLENNPRKYYESLSLSESERKSFFKLFPKAIKEDLPKITLTKSGIITLTYKNETSHFTFSDLAKNQVYIKDVLVKLPVGDIKSFTQYFNIFNKNMNDAFSKKITFIKVLNFLNPVTHVHAMSGSEYLAIPDGDELPIFKRQGYDKSEKIVNNLYDDTDYRHNIRQTKQVLLAAIIAISSDLNLDFLANYDEKKKNLPNNLKMLYDRIHELASSCNNFKNDPSRKGDFASYNKASKMLTSLDLVNEKINRLESLGKDWWGEIDRVVWSRTSFSFNPDAKSYNICKVKRIAEIYEDKRLCGNLDKITNCLIEFQSSGRVSNKRLNDAQMDLVIENLGGEDYGQDDVIRWIEK